MTAQTRWKLTLTATFGMAVCFAFLACVQDSEDRGVAQPEDDSGPQVLYDNFFGYVAPMHADERWLWWSTGGIYQAPADGSSPPTLIGYPEGGSRFASDDTYIYWLAYDKVYRRRKEAPPAEEAEALPLGPSLPFGAIARHGDDLYLCNAFASILYRMPAAGGPLEIATTQLNTRGDSGGGAFLSVSGSDILIAYQQDVFAFDTTTGAVRHLADSLRGASMVSEVFGAYYVFERPQRGEGPSFTLVRLREGSPPEQLIADDLLRGPAFVYADAKRKRLIFSTGKELAEFDVESSAVHVLVEDPYLRGQPRTAGAFISQTGGFAVNQKHVFWSTISGNDAQVLRMRRR